VIINDEDELYDFIEPYMTGAYAYCTCNHRCDCEPDKILKDGITLNGEPYNSFTWWNSQFLKFPCEVIADVDKEQNVLVV